MKHGDKAKNKAAKAKTSGKKVSSKNSAKENGGKAGKAAGKKESSSPVKAEAAKKVASPKGSSVKAGSIKDNTKASPKTGAKAVANSRTDGKAARFEPQAITFTNPAIESAFKRAVKKYPNAFRRLTD